MSKIDDLIFYSVKVGSDVAYVQAGGGNTSVKFEDRMAIKASGTFLKNMTQLKGFCFVDHHKINDYLKHLDSDNDLFSKTINSFVIDNSGRPSIETGFHAILKNAVIHTHSVFANILTCSCEGMEIAKQLFSDSLWIDYGTPGSELVKKIMDQYNGESIIFLKNHGLIVTADTLKDAYDLHERVNETIKRHFNISFNRDVVLPLTDVIFPDQVVCTSEDDVIAAYSYILNTIKNLNLTLSVIPKEKVDILKNMESEKYRKGLLKK